jgi:hypothetical protein
MTTNRRWPGWYALAAAFVSSAVISGSSFLLSAHSTAESIQRDRESRRASELALCGVVATMDDAYRETPPTTPAGRNLAASIAELRQGLGCPPG